MLDEGLDVPAVDVGIVEYHRVHSEPSYRGSEDFEKESRKSETEFWVLYAKDTTETRFSKTLNSRTESVRK